MTLQEIRSLFEYDKWANDRTLESVASVPESRYLDDLKSSHGGIHGTLVHIFGASMVWLQRWKGNFSIKAVTAAEIGLLADGDVGLALDAIVVGPPDLGHALEGLQHRPWPRQ